MSAVGNYEVVSQAFSYETDPPETFAVDAPSGKVTLGGGLSFSSNVSSLTYDSYPSEDGSAWNFLIKYNTDSGIEGLPVAGTAYVTCAELGVC
jgi:hypothetical protein